MTEDEKCELTIKLLINAGILVVADWKNGKPRYVLSDEARAWTNEQTLIAAQTINDIVEGKAQ